MTEHETDKLFAALARIEARLERVGRATDKGPSVLHIGSDDFVMTDEEWKVLAEASGQGADRLARLRKATA